MATMAGGAGAGGAGAGGAGAGGAGAGGAGAGGAGAGGAGAGGAGGGHAGGVSSTLLNAALAITHDAISGNWDGTPDPVSAPMMRMPVNGDLAALDASRRIDMLVSELSDRFDLDTTFGTKAAPENGTAKLIFDGGTICDLRAPTLDQMQKQLIWVRSYADLRQDRLAEINVQLGDILSFFGAISQIDAGARERSLDLMIAVQRLTYMLTMRIKSACWMPRPIDFSTRVQPVIQTPDHSTFPSGHASEAFALATVLTRMMDNDADIQTAIKGDAGTGQPPAMQFRLAHRIAVNRTVAGVHFPIDSAAGAQLGIAIGDAIWTALQDDDAETLSTEFVMDPEDQTNSDFLLSTLEVGQSASTISSRVRGAVAADFNATIAQEWS